MYYYAYEENENAIYFTDLLCAAVCAVLNCDIDNVVLIIKEYRKIGIEYKLTGAEWSYEKKEKDEIFKKDKIEQIKERI